MGNTSSAAKSTLKFAGGYSRHRTSPRTRYFALSKEYVFCEISIGLLATAVILDIFTLLDIITAHSDTVAIMLLDPKHLIDRSIADLTQLSILLAAEIRDEVPLRSPELRACEEAVATISSLIPRLQVARNARISPLRSSHCPHCDD